MKATRMIAGLVGRFCLTAVLLTVTWGETPAHASQANSSSSGRVGTLPGQQETAQRGDLLAGHVYLLGKTVDQAIEDLQNGDLRQFAKSYRRMVAAYTTLSDHIGCAAETVGGATMRVELARESLADVDSIGETDPKARRQLVEDIGQIRALLIGKLAALRARLEHAKEDQKPELLQKMRGLFVRITQLDKLTESVEESARPLLPGLAANELHRQLDEIDQSLEQEEDMLSVVADSAHLSVDTLSQQVRRTMLLLEVEATIPVEQMAELAQTREAVHSVLDEITAAHRRAANSAIDILARSADQTELQNPEQLLQQVDGLLRDHGGESAEKSPATQEAVND